MNLLCLVFGHKSLEGIYSGAEYMRVVPGSIDGIGREHARLYAHCPRCEREYTAGAIHLPPRALERNLMSKQKTSASPNAWPYRAGMEDAHDPIDNSPPAGRAEVSLAC